MRGSCGVGTFVDQAAEDGFSVDPCGGQVGDWRQRGVASRIRDLLTDALMWPGGVVMDLVFVQEDGVHVQEVDGEDPSGLGVQELPPGRAAAAWRRIDARGFHDLVDGRWRDRDA